MLLTGRVIGLEDEDSSSAVELISCIEDHFVRWDAFIGHGGSHVVGWAVDDEIAKERLTLPEGTIVGSGRVELVQTIKEVLLGVREQLVEVCGCTLGG